MLSGLSAFTVTPADDAGVVDTAHLQQLVARLAGSAVASVGVLGSTGSYMYLTPAERDRALHAAVEAAENTPVLAGVGAMTTREVLHHVRSAEAAGAAGLLLAPVSYLPLTDDDFAGLVADVAGATDLPICLYNNPTTTGFTISDALAIRLSELPGVKAVKNPAPATYDQSAQHVHKLCTEMSDDFVVGYSGDALIAGPLAAGAQAWYSVVAGTLPDLALAIWNARDDKDKVYALHGACAPLWDLFAEFGGIRVVPEVLNLMGLGPVTSPKPLLPLGPDAIARIEAALDVLPTPELERA